MLAIFKRELRAYFTSPIGYVILTISWFFSGMFFVIVYKAGVSAPDYIFGSMFLIVLFLIPVITMRLFSEEKRQRTDQLLLCAPVRSSSIVLGKFLGALVMFASSMAITLVYMMIFMFNVENPGWSLYIANLLGVLLLGAALIALGMFISALTESQVIAAIATIASALALNMVGGLLPAASENVVLQWLSAAVNWISLQERYSTFTQGTINYPNVFFFLSLAGVFLFLAVRTLEKKRWA